MKHHKYGFAPNPGFLGKRMTAIIVPNPLGPGLVVISCEVNDRTRKKIWPGTEQIKKALLVKHLVESEGVK